MLVNSEQGSKISVIVRKRPLFKKEAMKGEIDIVDVRDPQTVVVRETRLKVDLTKFIEEHYFNFDMAFDSTTTNESLYLSAVRPIIEAAFNQARVSCFAYGQTGSGKTYTMLGDQEKGVPGLYLLASYDIFSFIEKPIYQELQIFVSFFEIYCGKLYDLLNDRNPLNALEDAKGQLKIVGLQEKRVQNVQELMTVIEHGQNIRVTGQNSTNLESSRSHALVQISLKQGKKIHGKLSFIDLAGSERGADVQSQNKQTRIDGAEINKSLLALKECIRALDQNKNHTPFRGSKLTLVLRDSFQGNCRTVMIGNISPSSQSSEHTLNTLRYADRVKELRKPHSEQLSGQDQLAKELMLPRQQKNVIRMPFKQPESDEEETKLTSHNQPLPQRPQSFGFSHQQQHLEDLFKVNSSNIPNQYDQNQLFSQEPNNLNQYIEKIPPLPPQKNKVEFSKLFYFFNTQNQIKEDQVSEYVQQAPVQFKQPQHPFDEQMKLQQLQLQHQQIIQTILAEEESVIQAHREHIDCMVDFTQKEMALINEVDQQGSDIQDYVKQLQLVMSDKMKKIQEISLILDQFNNHLQLEEDLSRQFYEKRTNLMSLQYNKDALEQDSMEEPQLLGDL